ncbi:YibE/F family protein [Virgibacillus sp. NKC19-3]|uniref:YibE/F family protein n=1 Tax=Virgibacillus saliphilus TaxID=2831674 RepID=UPI001C9AD2B2|nr:YibE/F family protein [Virgibacillus sp. NKC19-3]MBY7144149.1 YibE/F family protein [Virgibacillus sp. NKC19-3]
MNVLVVLAIILFVLMALIGGGKGIRSFVALFLNFGVLLLTIIIMSIPTINPLIPTLMACTVISCINLFYINEVNRKTKTAFLSTMITIVLLLFFIIMVTEKAKIQGFGEEETEEISAFSLYVGVDFVKVAACMIIMSAIGSIIDVAISIASPINEIYRHNPSISRKALFTSGLKIGRDILGTDTNTLFFAFFGSYLGLLIWFKDLSYTFGEIINSNVFSAEIINILCAGIGVALIIPITAWITSYSLVKQERKSKGIRK